MTQLLSSWLRCKLPLLLLLLCRGQQSAVHTLAFLKQCMVLQYDNGLRHICNIFTPAPLQPRVFVVVFVFFTSSPVPLDTLMPRVLCGQRRAQGKGSSADALGTCALGHGGTRRPCWYYLWKIKEKKLLSHSPKLFSVCLTNSCSSIDLV